MTSPDMQKNSISSDVYARSALLPEGFHDALAPDAAHHADVVGRVMSAFERFGYERVRPPLVEFEDSLFAGPGQAKAGQCFRFMDPETQKAMAVRADITPQISRLAATRLSEEERPLRLMYSGTVLRVVGSQIRPTREFMQAGIELIGSASVKADEEVISVALAALESLQIADVTVDLTIAPLGAILLRDAGLDTDHASAVAAALAARDVGELKALGCGEDTALGALARSAGAVSEACDRLRAFAMPKAALELLDIVEDLARRITAKFPDVAVTMDPCETHGFEYKSGVGFALFSGASRSEIGRGGRYSVIHAEGVEETATGFSAYLDSLVPIVPKVAKSKRIYLPEGTASDVVARLQEQGWQTVQGLSSEVDFESDAKRLRCNAFFDGQNAVYLSDETDSR